MLSELVLPLEERLSALPREVMSGLRRGIEKESLRVQPDGALGDDAASGARSARRSRIRTSPPISASRSSSSSPACIRSADACLGELTEIHQVVYRAIGDELLWGGSMPCRLPADDKIPIGQLRHVQRRPRQERLPHGPVASLRPAHADDLRHPLQLVAAEPAATMRTSR